MEDADERRAWELLHNGDIAVINTEIIKRINDAERYKHLEWILRKVVSEELKALPLTLSIGAPQVRQQSDENNTDNENASDGADHAALASHHTGAADDCCRDGIVFIAGA